MGAARTRSAAFFIQYLTLLLVALAWVQLDFVRRRVGQHLGPFYLLLGATLCYLAFRAYLVLGRRVSDRWRPLWLSVDLGVITCAVYLTGGINSEAALLYFWPIATSSIQRLPRRTVAVGIATAVLYAAATWQDYYREKYLGTMVLRMTVLFVVTSLATYYALAEVARIEELARLREKVALADYRQRLSREMHDGIQHYLADIAVRLELARRLIAQDPSEAARLAVDQRFAVRQAAGELRYLVRLLRSPAVEREGFVEALRHHLATFAEASGVSAPLEIKGETRPLPSSVAHTAFRIVQEAVMNVEKHARATEVNVSLHFAPDSFACTIKDNGCGFDLQGLPGQPTAVGGLGLSSMRQRAESVGGKLDIASSPMQGTQIGFAVPLGHPDTEAPRPA